MAKDLKNLMSIPGVGVTTAMMTIQLVGDIHRFESARQLAAFVGVAPYPKESGTSVRGGSKISRRGNSHYRKVLYMAALSAKLHNPGFQDFARKKDAEGKPKKVVTLAVARKLLHLMFAILKSKKPYDVEKVATSRLKAESMRKEKAKKSEK